MGEDMQVAAMAGRFQIGHGGAGPAASGGGHVHRGDALEIGAAMIIRIRQAGLFRRRHPGFRQLMPDAGPADLYGPVSAVIGVAGRMVGFGAFEKRQHLRIGPAGITGLGPAIVILRAAARIGHAVD